jgi:hypothetical protein
MLTFNDSFLDECQIVNFSGDVSARHANRTKRVPGLDSPLGPVGKIIINDYTVGRDSAEKEKHYPYNFILFK